MINLGESNRKEIKLKLLLNKIFRFLGNINSLYYVLIYLSSIFVFAFIYSVLPNSFYHSSVKYENSTKQYAQQIISDLQSNIFTLQGKAVGDDININDEAHIDGKNLYVSSLKLDDNSNQISFKIRMYIWANSKTSGLCELSFDQELSFSLDSMSGYFNEDKNEMVYFFDLQPIDPMQISEQEFNFSLNDILLAIFPNSLSRRIGSEAFLEIPNDLLTKLDNLLSAYRGFPSNISDNFQRMLYFSSVTITTVGFGDIIPLTDIARALVAIESVLGTLLLGLFFYSLGAKITREKYK